MYPTHIHNYIIVVTSYIHSYIIVLTSYIHHHTYIHTYAHKHSHIHPSYIYTMKHTTYIKHIHRYRVWDFQPLLLALPSKFTKNADVHFLRSVWWKLGEDLFNQTDIFLQSSLRSLIWVTTYQRNHTQYERGHKRGN